MTTPQLPRVRAADDGHNLITEDGAPFFWMGDTAWELFHRLGREEAEHYFAVRQQQRFNVIQAVALAEVDGLNSPDVYGEHPLIDNDPLRPNEAYFARVDETIRMAAARQLYIGLLPTWGDKVTPMWGAGPVVFDPHNAYQYGLWLGQRYRDDTNVIWILGGDRPAVHETQDFRPIWNAMARGIREGVQNTLLMTYHPTGGQSTSAWLHDEPWLDLHMMQSGHGGGHDVPVWEMIAHDYALSPAKPTLDGEPNYEDHPVSPWPKWDPATGHYDDYDVRKQLYRSVFAGGCGVTYGHHSVWQMFDSGREPINYPLFTWREALQRPGAWQVQHLRGLMESRPALTRIPAQDMLVADPGAGGAHVQAARDSLGRYAFVYLPQRSPVTVRLDWAAGDQVRAQWFDPRSGEVLDGGVLPRQHSAAFQPPQNGPDWVLVLDSLS